jgi:hypothetical protein
VLLQDGHLLVIDVNSRDPLICFILFYLNNSVNPQN